MKKKFKKLNNTLSFEIDIMGLDKAEILTALYNLTLRDYNLSFGQGFFPFKLMTQEEARTIIFKKLSDDWNLYFDFLYGRPLKVNLNDNIIITSFNDQYQNIAEAMSVINYIKVNTSSNLHWN